MRSSSAFHKQPTFPRPSATTDSTERVVDAPLSIRHSSSLSEDFIQRQDLFLSPGKSTLALYRNPFKGDLIEGVVALNGTYSTLTRDEDGGTWTLEATDLVPGCTEVVSVDYAN